MSRYVPLIEVAVRHAYYADGRCRGLRFVPVADTAAWLREVDGRCRDTDSGLAVFGEIGRLGSAAARPSGLGLVWAVRCEDACFAAVTEGLPVPASAGGSGHAGGVAPVGEVLRFAAAEHGPGDQRLHAGHVVGAADAWPLTWPAVSAQLGPAERQRPPLGLLTLPAPRADSVEGGPLRYTIRFAARAPVWKYCFVGHWSDDALEVVASGVAASKPRWPSTFGEPKAETLPDGRPVLAFLSAQGIELRERPEQRFELRRAADKRVLLERLPAPAAGSYAFEPIGAGRRLVSEIYVHR